MKKPEWVDYLISIGIPEQYAEVYAPKFVEQQTLKKFLKFIPDDKLQEIYGINLDGHRLAIRHSTDEPQAPSTTPTTSTSNAGARANVRYHPPQLKPSMTPSSFRAFVEHWTVYKKLVGIPSDTLDSGGQIFTLTCADHPEIRRTIADHKSNHLELGENDYIEMLRKLLTARANPETYRNKLFYMTQNSDETCHQWLKRLKEVAPDCEMTMPCSNKPGDFHNYGEYILRTKFILGICNTNIKQELLTKSRDLPTLDAVFNHATQMEATLKDLEKVSNTIAEVDIHGEQCVSSDEEINRISNYKKSQKTPWSKQPHKCKPCDGCGSTQHTSEERPTKCWAWKKVCNNCKKKGHINKVCRARKEAEDSANAVIADIDGEQQSNEIDVVFSVKGVPSHQEVQLKVYPDTGASICVAGLQVLRKLGLKLAQLKQTSRNIRTATGSKIHCVGYTRAKLTLEDYTTFEDIYICRNVQRIYLSKKGCIALGLIAKDFPKPIGKQPTESPPVTDSLPHRPQNIPFEPTPENIPRLKEYWLKVFSKTAFNNDKNSHFPKMLGVPQALIHLMPDAKPYCRTTPNQIPYFWLEATKELLDEFVRRGMIAKTPIGTPTP